MSVMRVARSFSGDVAIRYLLPVSWMTPCLHMMTHVEACRYVAASDVIASSCAGVAETRRVHHAGVSGWSLQCIIAVFSQIYPGFQDPDFNLNPASAYT